MAKKEHATKDDIYNYSIGISIVGPTLAVISGQYDYYSGGSGDDSLAQLIYATGVNGGVATTIDNKTELFGDSGSDTIQLSLSATGFGSSIPAEGMTFNNIMYGDGGSGNDSLISSLAAISYLDGSSATVMGNTQTLSGGSGDDVLKSVMSISSTGGWVSLVENTVNLNGGAGNDSFISENFLEGNILAIDGGSGSDFALFDRSETPLDLKFDLSLPSSTVQYLGDGSYISGIEQIQIFAGSGSDFLTGGTMSDTIFGGHNNDSISGGSGNDLLDGGSEDDLLKGDAGNDTIYGGLGRDVLVGGNGNDQLWGGDDSDVFIFGKFSGSDTIKDFQAEDAIFLTEGVVVENINQIENDVLLILSNGSGEILVENTDLEAIRIDTSVNSIPIL